MPPGRGRAVTVLLAAGSAAWEAEAVAQLSDPAHGVHLLKRCLDLADLLGAAATGTADVAVVSTSLSGLDADSVARLRRSGVRLVVVAGVGTSRAGARLTPDVLRRMEVDLVLGAEDLPTLGAQLRELAVRAGSDGPDEPTHSVPTGEPDHDAVAGRPAGRLVAVWGPPGAPGRTSVAIGVAAEAAARGHRTLLLDADPYGGTVAPHLAVLDEVSGLLGATRLANAGRLDVLRLAALARALDPGLRVVTGLPRPARWTEVRPAAFGEVLSVARAMDDLVVVDTGPGIEPGADDPFDVTPNRDETTRMVLAEADSVVLVAVPDPVGLQRAARALAELGEVRPAGADIVAVNRMRSSLGWHERDVVGLLHRVAPRAGVVFLPDDPQAADRALVTGRTLAASGDSGLRRAVAALTAEVLAGLGPPTESAPRRGAGRRLGVARAVRLRR